MCSLHHLHRHEQSDLIGSQTNGKLPWEGCKTSHSPPLVHGLKRADCGKGAKLYYDLAGVGLKNMDAICNDEYW